MKKFIFTLFAFAIVFPLFSQDRYDAAAGKNLTPVKTEISADTVPAEKYWKFSGVAGLNISQVGMWNWSAGGSNNANGRIFANLTLAYKKNSISWETNLDTEFGMMYVPETPFIWRKPNDKIVFSSKFGYEFKKTWFFTILGGFRSQYAPGYEYKIESGNENEIYASNWLSPSYTDISLGVDWKPNTIFTLYFSPVAGRFTTCTVDTLRSRYGIPEDKTCVANLGMTFKAGVNYSPPKAKELKIISTLTLYTPYTSKTQKFGNIDVDWDLAISYQFLKVLNVSLGTSLKYYDQVMITDKKGNTGPRVQFKEVIGIGIGYTF